MRLVLASNNPGKLAELRVVLAPLGIELVAQGQLGIDEADEPHPTFLENALTKARHASRASGSAAIADDSGLCVEALGGAPGVASAIWSPLRDDLARRLAGDREALRRAQDAANNRLLLDRLYGCADRRAAYVATLVALRHADDPEPIVATGRWQVTIGVEARGSGGFGYDACALVVDDGVERSVAELDAATKNAVGHRARAAAAMRDRIRERWQPRAGGSIAASGLFELRP